MDEQQQSNMNTMNTRQMDAYTFSIRTNDLWLYSGATTYYKSLSIYFELSAVGWMDVRQMYKYKRNR